MVAAVTLLNLAGLVFLVRRLKALDERATAPEPGRHVETGPDNLLGTAVPELNVASTDGRRIDRTVLVESGAPVGFFSAGCQPCHEQAPEFARLTSGTGAVAFVTGSEAKLPPLVDALAGVRLVVGPPAHTAAQAFGVTAFPTMLRLDRDGTVATATFLAGELESPAPALAR
jgi:hypothetical protein